MATPHADKVRHGGMRGVNHRDSGYAGDDAYFIGGENAMGVADGVGQWREKGIDSGKFSRKLMSSCLQATKSSYGERLSASALLVSAASGVAQSEVQGSSTACIITLDKVKGIAEIANLGDSGVLIGRWNEAKEAARVVFRSPQQEHEFGYPFQLGHHEHADHPATAQTFTAVLEVGDIVLLGTDGLFDNVSDAEILEEAFSIANATEPGAENRPIDAQSSLRLRHLALKIASSLAEMAYLKSMDKRESTPFSRSASEAFDIVYQGGKKDDITVVVGCVAPNS